MTTEIVPICEHPEAILQTKPLAVRERLIAEILETQTATRGLEHLLHVRKLLDECVRNLQELVLKKSGRDPRGLMQLRSKFLMLSMADREARLPLQRRVDKNKVASRVPGAATGAGAAGPGGSPSAACARNPRLISCRVMTPSPSASRAENNRSIGASDILPNGCETPAA